MASEEMAYHEAAHAVVAVQFDLCFDTVTATPIFNSEGDMLAAALIGKLGDNKNSKQIRIVALAGCVGQVLHEWPRLLMVWEHRPNDKKHTQRDRIISRLSEHGKDMETYKKYSSPDVDSFDDDLDEAINLVSTNFVQIKRVAKELCAKNILKKQDIIALIQ